MGLNNIIILLYYYIYYYIIFIYYILIWRLERGTVKQSGKEANTKKETWNENEKYAYEGIYMHICEFKKFLCCG